MPLIRIATIFNIDLEFETAEIHKRIFAYVVDFMLLLLYFIAMKFFYYGTTNISNTEYLQSHMGLDILTISLPMLLYSLVSEVTMHGQTFGKRLMNIRVVSLDGQEPSLGQYLTRWMFKAFEWPFFFGYTFFSGHQLFSYILVTGFLGIMVLIIIAATRKNQRLGDFAANTVVVETTSPYNVNDTVFMEIDEVNYQVAFPEVLKLSDRDINTIKGVLDNYQQNHRREMCLRVAVRVKNVLQISTEMEDVAFLEKLLADYNYLAAK